MRSISRVRCGVGVFALGAAALGLTGCNRHYQVTDTAYGDVYYTDSLSTAKPEPGQQISFVDADTGAVIRLSQYEIKRSSRRAVAGAAQVQTASAGEQD